jgi:HAMP domain-containing protein
MWKWPKIVRKYLSVRLSLMVVFAIAILLSLSLVIMLHFSRQALKHEALQSAEQTLEGMVYNIDNVLLSVEQTTGNTYFSMAAHMDDPDLMFTYAKKLVETNPYVAGCAIAFKENYYKGRKQFMAYMHHADSAGVVYADSDIESDDMFAETPYTEQRWFTQPMETGKAEWMNPLQGMTTNEEPIFTFCLPLPGPDGKPVGVMGVDVSLSLLSDIVDEATPSENSYCTLIDRDGTFIVHPNTKKVLSKTTLMLKEQSAKDAAQAMIEGGTGYRPFRLDGKDYYVFYKPFKRIAVFGRSTDELGWSAGIVYPADDIFGAHKRLAYYVLAIAIIGLLLLFIIICSGIHWQLKPLNMLTEQAGRIAKGNLDEPIPDSWREDEIGRLQSNFKMMQQSLGTTIGELEQLTSELKKHGEELSIAYEKAQKADRMKTAFLHNMTNQMLEPSKAISRDVEALCNNSGKEQQRTAQLADDIQRNGTTIAELLNNLLNMSEEDIRKEADHV